MAVTKYVGEEAIERVSQYVNRKLTVVSAMPSSPFTAQVVLYVGQTTYIYTTVTPVGTEDPSNEGWYELNGTEYELSVDTSVDNSKTYYVKEVELYQGGIYMFNGSEWILQEIMKTRELTKAEYTALSADEKKNGTIYFVKDDDSGAGGDAYDIEYDNSISLLDATNVQDAIDEVVAEKQNLMQYETMPTASSDNLGVIIQYVGETTSDYTNGYFYKSTYNSSASAYVWEVVVGANSGAIFGYYNTTDGKFYEESTFTTEITGAEGTIYVDQATNYIYRYDETATEFIQIGGAKQPLFIDSENYISIDYDLI